jgi:hypothetical protein
MRLESFKQILLQKSAGNKILSSFVQDIGGDFIASCVSEVLEKMASTTKRTGFNANRLVAAYAANLDPTDVRQLRDAMSHHVSHYRAALKKMHSFPENSPERTHMREVADQHLEHLLPLMHLAGKAGFHSKDLKGNKRLALSYVDHLPAWETNYTTIDRHSPSNTSCPGCVSGDHAKKWGAGTNTGHFMRDTEKLDARPSKNSEKWSPAKQARGVPDLHYLEMAPHPGHKSVSEMPHTQGYPWDEVQIGSPKEIDEGKGYLSIDDVPDKQEYTPHPFDAHPLNEKSGNTPKRMHDINNAFIGPENAQKIARRMAEWHSSPHHEQWLKSQEEAYKKDPKAYMARGTKKPAPFWDGSIPLEPQLGHVHQHPKMEAYADKQKKRPSAGSVLSSGIAAASKAVAPAIRRAAAPTTPAATAAAPSNGEYSWKNDSVNHNMYEHVYKSLPPALKVHLEKQPAFMKYLAARRKEDPNA